MSYFDELDKSEFYEKKMKGAPQELKDEYYEELLEENKEFKKWFKYHYPFFHNLRHENNFVRDIIKHAFLAWDQANYEEDGKYETYVIFLKNFHENIYREMTSPGLNSIKSFIMYCAFRERHRLRIYEGE